MFLLLGIPLIFVHLIFGVLLWSVIKAKARIDGTLKDSIASDDLISGLVEAGFFDKGAVEASDSTGKANYSTGKTWENLLAAGAGYQTVIDMEAESSSRSFKIPRNAFLTLSIIVFGVEYLFLPTIYLAISGALFFLMSFVPQTESGVRRALSELSALSWLVFHFYKFNPEECTKCLATSSRLKHLFEAIARLDPEYRRRYENREHLDISPAVFRDVYLHMPTKFRSPTAPQVPSYGLEIEGVVAMLVSAGLGPGQYWRHQRSYRTPPNFWHKAATAANQLHAWLRQNPAAPPEARAAQARTVVHRTGSIPRYLR
jgi:hypothetical protein